MSILDAALDNFDGLAVTDLHNKALNLADFFDDELTKVGLANEFERQTPIERNIRGAQLSYSHPDAYAICQALIADGVIADFRSPDIIRFGFSPLFLSFQDMHEAIARLATIMQNETYKNAEFQIKAKVT